MAEPFLTLPIDKVFNQSSLLKHQVYTSILDAYLF